MQNLFSRQLPQPWHEIEVLKTMETSSKQDIYIYCADITKAPRSFLSAFYLYFIITITIISTIYIFTIICCLYCVTIGIFIIIIMHYFILTSK